jgi:haloalkane dehalogenase
MTTITLEDRNRASSVVQPDWLDPAIFPFESHYLNLDGHRIHYIDEGSGPLLLFLHANPLWSLQYRHIIAPLREHFRCVALDYPGFGLSEALSGYVQSLKDNSTLVEQFIQALDLRDIALVAHDTSVSIGLGVVTRHPDWFKALVLSNSFAWPLREDPAIYRFIRVVASSPFRFMIINFNFLLRYTVGNLKDLSAAERRAYLMPYADKSRRRHQHDLFRGIINGEDYLMDLKNRLPEISHLPTLLAFADADPTAKSGWLERYQEIFPQHRSVPVVGSHHFPQEYNPAAMVQAIQIWWDETID